MAMATQEKKEECMKQKKYKFNCLDCIIINLYTYVRDMFAISMYKDTQKLESEKRFDVE
jgi:hypothetical protein